MPGLVAVKSPTHTTPFGVSVTEYSNGGEQRPSSPMVKPSLKKSQEKRITDDSSLDNPDMGPFLLKLARDAIASSENLNKALKPAILASKSFKRCSGPGLELATCWHVVAAIYSSLGGSERRFTSWSGPLSFLILEKGRTTSWRSFPVHAISGYIFDDWAAATVY